VEALFCRTLVLTSNCKTGPAELIKDKKNGYVFESNNIESFHEQIQ
jgi:glycosyltransferase involved in cell wall biosynthesis